MKLLKKIKRWFSPKETLKIEDDLFGSLSLKEFKNPKFNYWSGKGIFKPTNTPIKYNIPTKGKNTLTLNQREFLKSFHQNYTPLLKTWTEVVHDEIGEALFEMGLNLEKEPLEKYFKVSYIKVPEKFHSEASWSIIFEALEIDPNHEFTIRMKGWRASGLTIDG